MKYKQISIKEAADRCRNGEAVYAARCIDGMSFREVAEATMLLVMEVPVPETEPKPEKAKKQSPPKKTIDRGKVKALHEAGWSNAKIPETVTRGRRTAAGRKQINAPKGAGRNGGDMPGLSGDCPECQTIKRGHQNNDTLQEALKIADKC